MIPPDFPPTTRTPEECAENYRQLRAVAPTPKERFALMFNPKIETNNNMTQQLKEQILDLISDLFSDTNADEQEQIDALEEIESLCSDNVMSLREQIRNS